MIWRMFFCNHMIWQTIYAELSEQKAAGGSEMRIDMDITTCVDVVIGVCMLVSILVGYHRGFLVTIARIVAMVASYIGAVLAAGTLKKMLAQTVFMPVLEKQMGSGALAQLAGQALEPAAEGIAYSVVFFVVFAKVARITL